MKFYPKETFELRTPLSISEILAILDTEVVPSMRFQWRADGRKFKGKYSTAGFTLTRIAMSTNGSRPVVEGTFHPDAFGTLIRVNMRLHRLITIFLLFWFSLTIVGVLSILVKELQNSNQSIESFLVSIGFILVPMTIVSTLFWSEARKNKRLLVGMFCVEKSCEPSGQPDW